MFKICKNDVSSNLLIPFVKNINISVPSKVTTELTMAKNKFKEGELKRELKSYNEKLMVIVLAFVTFLETLLSNGKNCNPFNPII